jgi:hypothetical protein
MVTQEFNLPSDEPFLTPTLLLSRIAPAAHRTRLFLKINK